MRGMKGLPFFFRAGPGVEVGVTGRARLKVEVGSIFFLAATYASGPGFRQVFINMDFLKINLVPSSEETIFQSSLHILHITNLNSKAFTITIFFYCYHQGMS